MSAVVVTKWDLRLLHGRQGAEGVMLCCQLSAGSRKEKCAVSSWTAGPIPFPLTAMQMNSSVCAENSNTNVKKKKKNLLQAGLQSWEQLSEYCQEGRCRNKPWSGENQLHRPLEAPRFPCCPESGSASRWRWDDPVSPVLLRLEAVFCSGV